MGISFWSILAAILILGLLVTIHEFGHYIVARLLKIRVYELSIFVGPVLFSWRKNDIDYSIRAFPFGAYVRFSDVDEEGNMLDQDDPALLCNQKRWKAFLTAMAGPFMNLVLGVLIFTCIFCYIGVTTTRLTIPPGYSQYWYYLQESGNINIGDEVLAVNGSKVYTFIDMDFTINERISKVKPATLTMRSRETGEIYDFTLEPIVDQKPMIGITHYDFIDGKYGGWEVISVNKDQNGGDPVLREGDYLVSVGGVPVSDEGFDEFFDHYREGDIMELGFYRNGEYLEKDCVCTVITVTNDRGIYGRGYIVNSPETFLEAFKVSLKMPASIGKMIVGAVANVFKGEEKVYNMLAGPVGVTAAVSEYVDDVDDSVGEKIFNLVVLCAQISILLVYSNMMPLPGLDGMQVLIILYETVSGRKLSKKTEGILTVVGFCIVLLLVVLALVSDIIRIVVTY